MIQKAVIDRIVEGKKAVLLVGEAEKELIIPVEGLPAQAVEGSWVNILEDGSVELDEKEKSEVKKRISGKMEKLKRKSNSSKFKKG